MKKPLFLLSLLFAIAISSSHAQRIKAYTALGGNFSQIEGDELKGFRQLGLNAGVGSLIMLDQKERWYLSVETLFSQLGSYHNTGNPYNINLRLSYVSIPLMINYLDPIGGILVGAGLSYGRTVQQPHSVMRYNPNYFIPDTSDFTFSPNDVSILADIRFPIWRGLMMNIRWQYSIIPIKRDWLFTEYVGVEQKNYINNCYNHSITLRLLYQF